MSVRRELDCLICAVQMMTRLPTPAINAFTPDLPTRASRYYPVAGWLVGGISALVFLGASRLGSPLVAAVLAVLTSAAVTGGFHEDGLADTADGLGGGQTPERRLEIMKDSRLGTYGSLALLLVVGLRIAALATFSPKDGALALLVAHSVARAAPILVMRFGTYAGNPASAKLPHTDMRTTGCELAIGWGLAIVPGLLLPWRGLYFSVFSVTTIALIVAHRSAKLIGGFTGDVLGGIEQLGEAAILTGLSWIIAAT